MYKLTKRLVIFYRLSLKSPTRFHFLNWIFPVNSYAWEFCRSVSYNKFCSRCSKDTKTKYLEHAKCYPAAHPYACSKNNFWWATAQVSGRREMVKCRTSSGICRNAEQGCAWICNPAVFAASRKSAGYLRNWQHFTQTRWHNWRTSYFYGAKRTRRQRCRLDFMRFVDRSARRDGRRTSKNS